MKTTMWLLVRSNPSRKDSIHYNFAEAQALQNHLAKGGYPGRYLGEKTEIHEITVDRESCAISVISSSFTTSLGPNDG